MFGRAERQRRVFVRCVLDHLPLTSTLVIGHFMFVSLPRSIRSTQPTKVPGRTAMLSALALALAVAVMVAPTAVAQDLLSNDGLWRATLDPFAPSGGNGQITNLFTPASSTDDNLFERWCNVRSGLLIGIT
jgi:hypothetical protein